MAERAFATLVSRVAPSAYGCPQPTVVQYIRDAAIEACERTLAWRSVLAPVTLVAGSYQYAYPVPAGTEVHAVFTATINDVRIAAAPLESVCGVYPSWPNMPDAQRAAPRYLVHLDSDTFAVAPVPDAVVPYVMRMIVALKPLRTAVGMEQTVFDELENVIVHGALQQLLVLPEKPWSDRELAGYHAKQFLFKVTERRARADSGSARAPLFVQMRPWA